MKEPHLGAATDFSDMMFFHPVGIALRALIKSFPEGSAQRHAMATAISRAALELREALDNGEPEERDIAFLEDIAEIGDDLGADISALPHLSEFAPFFREDFQRANGPAPSFSDDVERGQDAPPSRTIGQQRRSHLRLVRERSEGTPTDPDKEDD